MPQRWLRAWLVGAVVVVFGPSLVVTVVAAEVWPWTCAPMFSAPLDGSTALYAPAVMVETARGSERFDPRSIGMATWHFRRLLLVHSYGAALRGPFGYRQADTPERLRGRLEQFFSSVVDGARHSRRFPADAARLRLVLQQERTPPGRQPARFDVGFFDVAQRRFILGDMP